MTWLWRLVSWSVKSFYDVSGFKKTPQGATLVVANHRNSGVDAVLVWDSIERPVRFIVKSPLFKIPVIGWVVKRVGCLPAYRKKDGDSTKKNLRTFQAVNNAFAKGDVVAVFPEGTSHDNPDLIEFKTGPARMALDAYNSGTPLKILPVGLHYFDKEEWRSRAVVYPGNTFTVYDWIGHRDPESWDTVQELTDYIETKLRQVTINAPSTDILTTAEKLAETQGISINQALPKVNPKLIELYDKIDKSGIPLKYLQVDPQLDKSEIAKDLALTASELPIIAVGNTIYQPAFKVTQLIYELTGRKGPGGPTVKVLVGLITYPLWTFVISRALKASGVPTLLRLLVIFTGWTSHLSARPLARDAKRRWKEILFVLRHKVNPEVQDKLNEFRDQLPD